ncbi:hypothetical protein [Microbacterium galbinum]|uniref:Uncharacterized protein n=1 Tax=Microbacterium galbinum TaxID=2851646 RepID=A0ABY4IT26_9MICO|nr:hypothetical protein [Microbacterium galbinum]UPL15415.1 hypothetical protein KV396_13415 [Microbacterium galbinum]
MADVTSMGTVASKVRVERSVRRVKGGWKSDAPKTAAGRCSTPLPRALRDELVAPLAKQSYRGNPSAALWPGRVPGSGGDPRGLDYKRQFDVGSAIRYYFKPALKELWLVGVRWRDLRHHYATVMISMIGKGAQ